MEIRKIQRVGTGTLCISLPKNWAKRFNISSGSKMQVLPQTDGSIEIRPFGEGSEQASLAAEIDLADISHEGQLMRLLIGSYVVGQHKATIASPEPFTPSQLAEIKMAEEQLLGAAIIEETENQIVMEFAVDTNKYTLQDLLRREVELVTTLYSPALKIIGSKDPDLIPTLTEHQREIDRFYWLSLRFILATQEAISQGLGQEDLHPFELLESRTIFRCLENATDSARSIINIMNRTPDWSEQEFDEKLLKQLTGICDLGTYMLKDAVEAALTHDAKTAEELIHRAPNLQSLVEQFQEWLVNSDYNMQVVLLAHHIAWCLSNLASCSTIISEIAINRAMDES